MQTMELTFLALLFAHMLGSLVSPTKRDSSKQLALAWVKDGLFYFLLTIACLFLSLDGIQWVRTILWLSGLAAVHLALDYARRLMGGIRAPWNGALIYVIDQFLHLVCITTLAALLSNTSWRQIASHLKERHFAEYFLIGTLMSLSCAMLAGMALNRMIYGSIFLK